MATSTFEAFSVSHAAILDGSTGAEAADIYGVREGTVEIDSDAYDNEGDDAVLSSWFWFNYAELTITSGYVPFPVISLLTGVPFSSTSDIYTMAMWTPSSLNQPARPVLLRLPSRDTTGQPRQLDIVLFKVFFQPINFEGPEYKEGLLLNYTGRAVVSPTDETGTELSEQAIGKIVNRPTP
jgi:hypothetical protein